MFSNAFYYWNDGNLKSAFNVLWVIFPDALFLFRVACLGLYRCTKRSKAFCFERQLFYCWWIFSFFFFLSHCKCVLNTVDFILSFSPFLFKRQCLWTLQLRVIQATESWKRLLPWKNIWALKMFISYVYYRSVLIEGLHVCYALVRVDGNGK